MLRSNHDNENFTKIGLAEEKKCVSISKMLGDGSNSHLKY